MNKAQRRVAIVIFIVIVAMFLFPPVSYEGAYRYEFIARITPGLSIDVALLFVQLLGVLLIGVLVFFITRTGSPLIDRENNDTHFKPK
jgi:hypothetical protein